MTKQRRHISTKRYTVTVYPAWMEGCLRDGGPGAAKVVGHLASLTMVRGRWNMDISNPLLPAVTMDKALADRTAAALMTQPRPFPKFVFSVREADLSCWRGKDVPHMKDKQ